MGGLIDIKQKGWEWVIHDHDLLVTKVRCEDLLGSNRGDFRCRHAVDLSSYHMGTKKNVYRMKYGPEQRLNVSKDQSHKSHSAPVP